MKSILGIKFDTRPEYLFHLAIITALLFGGFYVGDKYFDLSKLRIYGMAIFWFVVLYISDSISETIVGI